MMNKILIASFAVLALFGVLHFQTKSQESERQESRDILEERVYPRSFSVDVKTLGELEALRSTAIASALKGDQVKIISLCDDGRYVEAGEVLVKFDPTPFEKTISDLEGVLQDKKNKVEAFEQAILQEQEQTLIDQKNVLFEIETAHMERKKFLEGDAPLETARYKSAMQKALTKFEDIEGYFEELKKLEEEGFLNPSERKQAEKKVEEEMEAYETAKMQYDCYINNVYPMQLKKIESQVKKTESKKEEYEKLASFRIGKAQLSLDHAKQELEYNKSLLYFAKKDLEKTEIKAPSSGMVVHREEYRSGQRRKPRVGDLVLKNQTILDLPDLTSLHVKSKVREIDLHKIDIGKKVTVRAEAFPNRFFTGKIVSLGVLALNDMVRMGSEKYFEVTISLDKIDSLLRPGMSVLATIHSDEVKNKLAIPLFAVFEVKGESFCYKKLPKGYALQKIKTGKHNEQWIEVQEGLLENDIVALSKPSSDMLMKSE